MKTIINALHQVEGGEKVAVVCAEIVDSGETSDLSVSSGLEAAGVELDRGSENQPFLEIAR